MKTKKTASPKKKSQKRSPLSPQLLAMAVIVLSAVLFFIWHQMNFREVVTEDLPEQRTVGETISVPDQTVAPSISEKNTDFTDSSTGKDISFSPPAVADGNDVAVTTEGHPADQEGSGAQTDPLKADNVDGSPPGSPDIAAVATETGSPPAAFTSLCRQSARTIRNFYQHLDEQAYIQDHDLALSSEAHFTALIQKLLDNPPVVSGETNDLFTILQNTAHFFRIIGKDNILLIKAILDQEKDRYENVLAEFYTLLHVPECPAESFNLRIPPSSPYEYAGFFLSTMGGRLYLFRRDSMSRMVVSFYAILLIDEANRNASNKYGIEISAAIDQLIEEMESTTYNLQLENLYLDKLYDLKEQYQ